MNRKLYKDLQEVIYTERLDNGLTVKLIPKVNYKKTYAVFFTDFGSIDQTFIPRGGDNYRIYPQGVAHFLEHSLFKTEEGDVSHQFSSLGATVNAYTSNTTTAYLCSFTSNAQETIETLINFVQSPHFTQESVEDEKKIIAQEIQMYKDDPDWKLTVGLIENLYPTHPVRYDVAGTLESIEQIDMAMLESNHATFYHPGNMQVIVIGNLEPDETIKWIKENQEMKDFPPLDPIKRRVLAENSNKMIAYREAHFPVAMPKVLVGIKGNNYNLKETQAFRHLIKMEIAMDLLFSETSSTYASLYNEELLDDSFSYDYIFERSFDYVSIGGDTRYPDELADKIKSILLTNQNNPDMTLEHFTLIKKKLLGQYIQGLNSLEFVAHQFVEFPYEKITFFDSVSILKSITFEEVRKAAKDYFKADDMSVFAVKPLEDRSH